MRSPTDQPRHLLEAATEAAAAFTGVTGQWPRLRLELQRLAQLAHEQRVGAELFAALRECGAPVGSLWTLSTGTVRWSLIKWEHGVSADLPWGKATLRSDHVGRRAAPKQVVSSAALLGLHSRWRRVQ